MQKTHFMGLLALLTIALVRVNAGTVYFVNDQDWEHVHAYCAVGDEWERPITKWPGVRMIPTETRVNEHVVYEFDYDDRKGFDRIIFNNDSLGQTIDLVLEPGKVYYSPAAQWYASPAEIPTLDKLPSDTIYFVNNIHWPKVCAYMAVGENWRPQNAVWPGMELKSTSRKAFGGDVLMLIYPKAVGYDHLIFNSPVSGEQTLDLTPEKGKYFVCGRSKTGTVDGSWQAVQAPQPKKKAQTAPAAKKSSGSVSSGSKPKSTSGNKSQSKSNSNKKKQQAKKKAAAKRR